MFSLLGQQQQPLSDWLSHIMVVGVEYKLTVGSVLSDVQVSWWKVALTVSCWLRLLISIFLNSCLVQRSQNLVSGSHTALKRRESNCWLAVSDTWRLRICIYMQHLHSRQAQINKASWVSELIPGSWAIFTRCCHCHSQSQPVRKCCFGRCLVYQKSRWRQLSGILGFLLYKWLPDHKILHRHKPQAPHFQDRSSSSIDQLPNYKPL